MVAGPYNHTGVLCHLDAQHLGSVFPPEDVADVVDADPGHKERVLAVPVERGRGLSVVRQVAFVDLVLETLHPVEEGRHEGLVKGRATVGEIDRFDERVIGVHDEIVDPFGAVHGCIVAEGWIPEGVLS